MTSSDTPGATEVAEEAQDTTDPANVPQRTSPLAEMGIALDDEVWTPGQTFADRFDGAERLVGYRRTVLLFNEAEHLPDGVWTMCTSTSAWRVPTETQQAVAELMGFPWPALDTAEELVPLMQRWLGTHGSRLTWHEVKWHAGPDEKYPVPWITVRGTGAHHRHDNVRVILERPGRGLELGKECTGWPLRMANYLVQVVPWLRDQHEGR